MKSMQNTLLKIVHKVLYWMIFGASNKEIIKVASLLKKYNISDNLINQLSKINPEIPRVLLQGYILEEFDQNGEPYEHVL